MKCIKTPAFLLLPTLLLLSLLSAAQDCEKVKITDFPAKDLPASFDSAQLRNAESYKYYYGIGVPIDYAKARHLAFIEMKVNGDVVNPSGGASVLLMLYANGYGVKRNIDLCIRLACANVGFAPAEIELRVQHLKDMKSGKSEGVFDICDDITGSLMEGLCQSIQSEKIAVKREAAIKTIIKSWSAKDKSAYEVLRKTATAFFDERVGFEVDLSGTARAVFELQESDSLENDFKNKIVQSDKCDITTRSAADFTEADKKLNAAYRKIMSAKDTEWGTITKEGIQSTQRKWIQYRDAWVRFGAIRCPVVTELSWKTLLTNERIDQLQDFIQTFLE